MVNAVKKFIEDNISYIENQNWKLFFTNWYIANVDYWWDDLIDVLKIVDENILEVTIETRKQLFIDFSRMIIAAFKPKQRSISKAQILELMQSVFGFEDLCDLYAMIDEAAATEGLQPSGGPYISLR